MLPVQCSAAGDWRRSCPALLLLSQPTPGSRPESRLLLRLRDAKFRVPRGPWSAPGAPYSQTLSSTANMRARTSASATSPWVFIPVPPHENVLFFTEKKQRNTGFRSRALRNYDRSDPFTLCVVLKCARALLLRSGVIQKGTSGASGSKARSG
jgi:hypothetical protein